MFAAHTLKMSAKEHYDNHLGNFYSWMIGDFETRVKEFEEFLKSNKLSPVASGVAVDLGAGHGIQTVALTRQGFNVTALDFNKQLLNELSANTKNLRVTVVEGDMRSVSAYKYYEPELIVCAGDTLPHLESTFEIEDFLTNCCQTLADGGKLVLSFRDYSDKLTGDQRFIPVKSDANRILTCFLDYTPTHVQVTDLLHEFNGTTWTQKVSSYTKVRITAHEVLDILEENKMNVLFSNQVGWMHYIIASK